MADFFAFSTSFNHWYKSPLGRAVAEAEFMQLNKILPRLFGLHKVQIGYMTDINWLSSSPIHHQVTVSLPQQAQTLRPSLYSNFTHLPFRNDSIDVILLPHTLELVADVQPILQEAWRTLTQDGHLLIFGFNPWSLWGLLRLFHLQNKTTAPWGGHFHSASTIYNLIADWGGAITLQHNFFFRPPLQRADRLSKLYWLETVAPYMFPGMGALYLLACKKQTVPLTPITTRWQWTEEVVVDKSFGTSAGRLNRG